MKGAPIKPTFKSVLVRTVIATVLFAVIISAMGNSAGSVAATTAIMFVILLGFGWLFDGVLHRFRMKKWLQKNGFSSDAGR